MKELKARREELKIKQQDLADELGISRTQLSRYENGLREADESIIEKWKGILFGLQFSDLEAGDYVYVRDDLKGGESYGSLDYISSMPKGVHEIDSFSISGNVYIKPYYYSPEMLDLSRSMKREDYLKMNEATEKFDFSDLCLKANKAVDDGLLKKFIRHENCIEFFGDYVESFGGNRADKAYEYIKSLYTEEFIIECESDVVRINEDAITTMQNGFVFKGNEFNVINTKDIKVLFNLLKGATVKQKKS